LKVLRRKLMREELDQEFRELNAGQVKANARLAVEELVVPRGVYKKEKSATVGRRMMRAEEKVGKTNKLPPVSVLLNRGDVEVQEREFENVQAIKGRVAKKVINIPTADIEEMELESRGEDVDFEGEQRDEVRVKIPQDILKVVSRSVLGSQGEPVEALSSIFLDNLVSDRMDIDLGELYDREIQEIVQDLEVSSRKAGVDNSPAREVKAEMIEREEGSRESRKKGDGKMSSESVDETEHIVIEDSMEGEVYMVRSMIQDGEDEPNPPRDVVTPVMESTPVEGREKGKSYTGFRPLTAPKKKMWVQPEAEVKEEEGEKSSDEESSTSRRSPLSAISNGRRVPVKEEAAQTRVFSPHNSPHQEIR